MVYLMDKNTDEIYGKHAVFAGNSYQTSDPVKNLIDN
ncbi:MAG: hypothetical protein ACI8ZM_003838 [Crocinitomix sp.]|jgi:hypothetical protein